MILIKFIIVINIATIAAAHATPTCNQSCGPAHAPTRLLYPFGFSAGCPIRLNCSAAGDMLVGDFPVKFVTSETIKLSIKAKCNRSLMSSVDSLFGRNYAPTRRNAILFENCSRTSPCTIPATLVQTHFDSPCNSNSSTMSCYSEHKTYGFLDRDNVTRTECQYLSSSISADYYNGSSVSLEVEVLELGWWLDGDCQCSVDANCTRIHSPVTGRRGFRCGCREGLVGDGYLAGLGCRKVSSGCNPSKYMSGQCGGTTRFGALIGGIGAGAFLMISLGLICCFIKRRSYSRAQKSTKRRLCEATGISIPIYPYKEIERATNGFSEKQRLGTGAYGTVYAGKLQNDEWVAVKRIKHRDTGEQITNEIKLISSVSHPNLVRLLGCSLENGEQILVYEFMPNGTLCQHLERERGDGLAWPARLAIATETAQAIAHLHSAINPPIYHRDIKSSNILLDYNFRSKVADFGLSRIGMVEISHISTAPQGTPGYLDPQYHQNFHLSDKSDVYSFGVVLVEIITAMKVVDFSRPQNEVNLANLATDRIGKGKLDEMIDPFLEPHRDAWTLSSIHKVAELAFRCLAFHRDMRPSMMEVAGELEQISLSRYALPLPEETNCKGCLSDQLSSCSSSSSSNLSEKPLSLAFKNGSLRMLETGTSSMTSMELMTQDSPVSMQDSWLSEASSLSSNSLLGTVINPVNRI